MIYFKTVELPQYSSEQIENGLRKASLKRTMSLDMTSPVSNIGSEKYFLGYQNGDTLTFTRIRTSFEKVLPRAIIKLTQGNSYYEIRLSLMSTVGFIFFGVAIPIFAIIMAFSNNGSLEGILFFIILIIVYVLLIMFELKLVKSKVNKAVTLCR